MTDLRKKKKKRKKKRKLTSGNCRVQGFTAFILPHEKFLQFDWFRAD